MMTTIDLRSDTVTKPTPGMLEVMMHTEVGDDVYGEDPAVIALEKYTAQLFRMEAALFCPSGTMTNQIAIRVHTQPGDELLCADNAHIYKYEGGGIASNSGVQARVLPSSYGKISANQIETAINADDPHFPKTSLVCLENTSNRGGGSAYSLDEMQAIQKKCKDHQLKLHLDGARVFNAMVAKQYAASQLGNTFDSISICLSKGLGAPVGSLLIGNKDFIKKSIRIRKVFGGGMRQAGYLAAAGLYALNNHIERLEIDHLHAKKISNILEKHPDVVSVYPVETNIIIFELHDEETCSKLQHYLLSKNIKANKVSPVSMRFVLHLDITEDMIEILQDVLSSFGSK
jgi:threonine aldolase